MDLFMMLAALPDHTVTVRNIPYSSSKGSRADTLQEVVVRHRLRGQEVLLLVQAPAKHMLYKLADELRDKAPLTRSEHEALAAFLKG